MESASHFFPLSVGGNSASALGPTNDEKKTGKMPGMSDGVAGETLNTIVNEMYWYRVESCC